MAQKSIIWSKEAQDDFLSTLEFYAERNGSKTYSEKLAGEIQTAIEKLKEHPYLGRPTSNDLIRILIKNKDNFWGAVALCMDFLGLYKQSAKQQFQRAFAQKLD